jgi:hypothetical protein
VRALTKSLTLPAVWAATIAPWAYRNYEVFHQFIPVSTQSGTNFLLGNNQLALAHPDLMGYLIDNETPDFEEQARGLNEAELDELALRIAKAWLWEHRDQWASLIWTKAKVFCSPVQHQPSRVARWAMLLSWWLVLPLAVPAIVATAWNFARNGCSGCIVHMLLLSQFVSYLVIYVVPRYRFPIEPFFIVSASVSVDWLVAQGHRVGLWNQRACGGSFGRAFR